MLAIIAALLPLLLWLIDWFTKNETPNPRQMKRANHLLAVVKELEIAAKRRGCKAEFDHEAMTAIDSEED